MKQPTFVLTLDEELMWGSIARTNEYAFARAHPDLRGVARDLLALFDRYGVSATWALVGQLFLENQANDLWCARDIIAEIVRTRTPQEIASHSFSHLSYAAYSRDAAHADLAACVDAAAALRISVRSFVFPRNRVGHLEALPHHGFIAYRGDANDWFARWPGAAKRAAHFFDHALALTPPLTLPYEHLPGLWNIPASMFFMHREGVRRFVPLSARVRKAKRGIDQAIATQSLFHLWFHPFNMCADRSGMFAALEEILAYVVASGIAIKTMGELARALRAECATSHIRFG